MKITEITVSAGRTFNDPNEQFSNFRPQVTLTATINQNDYAPDKVRELQGLAECLVEQEKKLLLEASEKKRAAKEEAWKNQVDPNMPF